MSAAAAVAVVSIGVLLGENPDIGDRHDPLAAPFANVGRLADDLVDQVPRPDEQIVGTGFADAVGRQDGNVRARQKLPLFVGVAIDNVVEKVCANPAVVEQRVGLAGSAIADDRLGAALRVDEEPEKLALRVLDRKSVV